MHGQPDAPVAPAAPVPAQRLIVRASRPAWVVAGSLALGLGVLGILLPLLPTAPFLILAAFCFSRGSRRLHNWLINHRLLGPPIRDWRDHRSISGKAKASAMFAILLVFAVSVLLGLATWALLLQGIVLAGVAVFLLTRPTPPDR